MKTTMKMGCVLLPIDEGQNLEMSNVEFSFEMDSSRDYIDLVKLFPHLLKDVSTTILNIQREEKRLEESGAKNELAHLRMMNNRLANENAELKRKGDEVCQ